MANHFKIPKIWPFKMVPNTSSPGIHFDDKWACEQIKSFEQLVYYRQKWVKANTTKLQVESSIAPESMKIYDTSGVEKKAISWSAVASYTSYAIYELTFDISDLPEGVYFIYQRTALLSVDWKAISEPIHSKIAWPNTLSFTYKNSFNKDDMAWSTGIEMLFRCEAGIMEPNFDSELQSYVNQVRNTQVIDGTPYNTFKLEVGDARGVAPYIIDILNRIFGCDNVSIEGLRYSRENNSKFETRRIKNYPLVGASLEITPSQNLQSLEFADTTPLAPGIVTAYNTETSFFGPGTLVPVTEVEENG